MKFWRMMAVLALAVAAPAFAQDVAPIPAPLPLFHSPVAGDAPLALPSSEEPAAAPVETPAVEAPSAAAAAIEQVTAVPQPVTLSAMVTDGGKPIDEGLVWRVFSTKPDSSGQLSLAAKSDNAVAKVSLSPGNYVVHVAYGRAQASDTITVKEGDNEKSIVLDAGGLRLNAAITGDVPIPINLLQFDVFTSGQTDADRALVAEGLGANDIITLNAGTYHIVSYFGDAQRGGAGGFAGGTGAADGRNALSSRRAGVVQAGQRGRRRSHCGHRLDGQNGGRRHGFHR